MVVTQWHKAVVSLSSQGEGTEVPSSPPSLHRPSLRNPAKYTHPALSCVPSLQPRRSSHLIPFILKVLLKCHRFLSGLITSMYSAVLLANSGHSASLQHRAHSAFKSNENCPMYNRTTILGMPLTALSS
jgi:hypothetical protein